MAVGGQTGRAVDDIGFLTEDDAWGMIQAKKNLRMEGASTSALADALEQLVEADALGVPDRPPLTERFRLLDPDDDRILVLTDHNAPNTINQFLAPVTDRLRDLPSTWPLADVYRNNDERRAFTLVMNHLKRLWAARHGSLPDEVDLRRLGRLLSVRAMNLVDGGGDLRAVHSLLTGVASRPEDVPRIWQALEREAQRLAEERSFLDRKSFIRRLELAGITLLPITRLRPDIGRLRRITDENVALLVNSLAIAAPERPVELDRDVSAVVAVSDGNMAITGVPGVGKTAVLHGLATTARLRGADVVVLRPENLRPTSGQVRQELNLSHDLPEVLTGWTGTAPGLLLIDGLDQTRGTDASAWLPDVAKVLTGTRWRVVATIRSFDLKYGPRWQRMFCGDPVDRQNADPGLLQVRHVLVADFTEMELAPLRTASPQLATLLDTADGRLRELLTNPFNLDLAAQLLQGGVKLDLTAIRSRADLLDSYWRHRVGDLERVRILRAVVDLMVREGRQVTNPVELPLEVLSQTWTALRHDGVLRDLPTSPGHASALVEFSHPVLFDYAVAMLALGDSSRPESLADRLDQDSNLAIKVRPSLEYRLATVWRDDPQRRSFWRLSLRLASREAGHPLAASAAMKVAAYEIQALVDCVPLADACAGTSEDGYGRWDAADARRLAFLLAAAIKRGPSSEETFSALAAFVNHLAQQAREADDVDLALLAAQLPGRSLANRPTDLASHMAAHLVPAAATCMTMALTDLTDPRRAQLAQVASGPFSQAVATDPVVTAPVVERLYAPDTLRVLGMRHMWRLIGCIPDIARKAPGLAVAIGTAAFEYEETRDEQTSLVESSILGLTSNRRDDLDGVRHAVGAKFKDLANIDASAATTLLLRVLEAPAASHQWPDRAWFPVAPHPRLGDTLRFSGGHGALLMMTSALIERLTELAGELSSPTDDSDASAPEPLVDIVDRIVACLRHEEVWQRLLFQAATTESPALALAFTPALLVPNLFAYPSTWIPAAHVARRLSPLLPPEKHAQLEAAIWGLTDATRIPGEPDPRRDERLRDRRDVVLSGLRPGHVIDPQIRQRLDELGQNIEALTLPELHENQLDGERYSEPLIGL